MTKRRRACCVSLVIFALNGCSTSSFVDWWTEDLRGPRAERRPDQYGPARADVQPAFGPRERADDRRVIPSVPPLTEPVQPPDLYSPPVRTAAERPRLSQLPQRA